MPKPTPARGTPAPEPSPALRTRPLDTVSRELRERLEALARVAFATAEPLARRALVREVADLHYQIALMEKLTMPRTASKKKKKTPNLDRLEEAILAYSLDRAVDLKLVEVDGEGHDGLQIKPKGLPVVVTVWSDGLVEIEESGELYVDDYESAAQIWRHVTGEDEG